MPVVYYHTDQRSGRQTKLRGKSARDAQLALAESLQAGRARVEEQQARTAALLLASTAAAAAAAAAALAQGHVQDDDDGMGDAALAALGAGLAQLGMGDAGRDEGMMVDQGDEPYYEWGEGGGYASGDEGENGGGGGGGGGGGAASEGEEDALLAQLAARAEDAARKREYNAKVKATADHWTTIAPRMAALYQLLKTPTVNFSIEPPDDHHTIPACLELTTCVRKWVPVILVRSEMQTRRSILFCSCTPRPLTLLRAGFLAATPVFPQVAFHLSELDRFHKTWTRSPIAVQAWADALWDFHRGRGGGYLTGTGTAADYNPGPLYRQVMTFYWDLLRRESLYLSAILEETERDKIATRCPACYGPRDDAAEALVDIERTTIVCTDACFSHNRPKNASTHDPPALSRPDIFLDEAILQDARMKFEATDRRKGQPTPESADPSCSDSWKAKDDGQPADGRKGDTGLMSLICSHDNCLKLVNLYQSGEKKYNVVAMIAYLLKIVDREGRLGLLYDVGCNLWAHLRRRKLIPEIMETPDRLKVGLALWHAYAHNLLCQMGFSPAYIAGFGMTDGEGCERFWAFMSAIIRLTRHSTAANRLLLSSLRAEVWNAAIRKGLVGTMHKRLQTTVYRVNEARDGLEHARIHNFPVETLEEQWEKQQAELVVGREKNANQANKALRIKIGGLANDLHKATLELAHFLAKLDTGTADDLVNAAKYDATVERLKGEIEQLVAQDLEFDTLEHIEERCRFSEARRALQRGLVELKLIKAPRRRVKKHSSKAQGQKTSTRTLIAESNKIKAIDGCRRSYTLARAAFVAAICTPESDELPPPEVPTVAVLLGYDMDNLFWTDPTFPSAVLEAWEGDDECQTGIYWLREHRRGVEELRKIQREIRRLLSWSDARATRLFQEQERWSVELDACLAAEETRTPTQFAGQSHLPIFRRDLIADSTPTHACITAKYLLAREIQAHVRLERHWINDGLLGILEQTRRGGEDALPMEYREMVARRDWADEQDSRDHPPAPLRMPDGDEDPLPDDDELPPQNLQAIQAQRRELNDEDEEDDWSDDAHG